MAKHMTGGLSVMVIDLVEIPQAGNRRLKALGSTQALIDQLVKLTHKYGDLPPVLVAGGMVRASVGRVEVCGGRDHILIEAVPEQE